MELTPEQQQELQAILASMKDVGQEEEEGQELEGQQSEKIARLKMLGFPQGGETHA